MSYLSYGIMDIFIVEAHTQEEVKVYVIEKKFRNAGLDILSIFWGNLLLIPSNKNIKKLKNSAEF